jgi:signal transduction histidine kinase
VVAGLTGRTVIASGVLALVVGGAFAVLLRTINEQRHSVVLAADSQALLGATDALERELVDMETGQRGFVLTGQDRFLQPWRAAQVALPGSSRQLLRLARVPRNHAMALRLVAAAESYVRDYSLPLVAAARRHEPYARSVAAADEGKRRFDGLRVLFDRLRASVERLSVTRERAADHDASRAVAEAAVGLAGSTLLVVLFGGYLARSIVLPLRRASAMAGRLARGDLATRMPENGVAEIGELQHSFNTMATSMEADRDMLRRRADEQAALRRVATLVARGSAPAELFEVVTAETGRLLGAQGTRLVRYESAATAIVVAAASNPPGAPPIFPVGAHLSLVDGGILATVFATRRSARIDDYERAPGAIAASLRTAGVLSVVGAPIIVEDRVWGVILAGWSDLAGQSADSEERIGEFASLVGTAVANADSRAALTASRARVVATADETRRHIERDLHDGAQQRLVHTVVTLKLAQRELTPGEPAYELVEDALLQAETATASLRELVHGILPAALSRGLRPAVDGLTSRLSVPVSVDVTGERLPRALEGTAYFVIAEALTNVVKHAQARTARVRAVANGGALRIEISDDGRGGARLEGSSGLLGLQDRVAALNGELRVDSPPGGGTTLTVTLPIPTGG